MRDHDPGWQPGRTRAVLQIRRAGKISCRKAGSATDHGAVQIHRIDFDDLRNSVQACSMEIFGDVVRDRRRREHDRGRRVVEDGTHTIMTRAAVRQRERNRDQPSLHGSQECRNVVKALRSQDHCPVSDRRMTAELACHIQCSAG